METVSQASNVACKMLEDDESTYISVHEGEFEDHEEYFGMRDEK